MANQAWQIPSPGQLSLIDLGPILKPGPKQALIRIHAVSLNYRDVLIVAHNPAYPWIAKPDLVPGSDGAGVIEEVGPDSKWKKGDRVIVQPNTWKSGTDVRDNDLTKTLGGGGIDGTFRRYMVMDDERLVHAPKGLSCEEACTIYTAGVTGWHALFHGHIKLEPGMSILTQGTGGVSCFAIQIAAAHGATVIATSSSDEKLAVAKKLGAKHLINYRKHPQWAKEVLKVTNGKGVDIVVEVVGADSIEQSVKATRWGGSIELVGVLSKDPSKPVDILNELLFNAGKTIHAILGAGSRELTEEFSAFLEKHQIHPQIAKLLEFEQMEEALELATNLTAPGKVVVRV